MCKRMTGLASAAIKEDDTLPSLNSINQFNMSHLIRKKPNLFLQNSPCSFPNAPLPTFIYLISVI